MPTVVFILGGSASGKSSYVRSEYIGTIDLPDARTRIEPRDGFCLDRWFDADRVKLGIPLYSDAPGDASSVERFGSLGLGGPSGPSSLDEYYEYPPAARAALEEFLHARTDFKNVEQLATELFDDPSGRSLGGGLTHELSKFLAQGLLEDALSTPVAGEHVIWDACGRVDSYVFWIDMALENGYDVEVVYTNCPLRVAQSRAASRKRRLDPSVVAETHKRAAETAIALERHVADLKAEGRPINFSSIRTSTDAEEAFLE